MSGNESERRRTVVGPIATQSTKDRRNERSQRIISHQVVEVIRAVPLPFLRSTSFSTFSIGRGLVPSTLCPFR